MLFLLSMFLLAVGGAKAWQKLTCPLVEEQQSLLMVWCRQTSSDCCTGVAFSPKAGLLDGLLSVTRHQDSFIMEVLELNPREGLYWCGRMAENGTIIKLAERHIYSSFVSYLWSLARWTLLPLLSFVVILIQRIYSHTN